MRASPSSSLGDSRFPDIGNGGYDAQHYDLALDYGFASKQLDGTATITVVVPFTTAIDTAMTTKAVILTRLNRTPVISDVFAGYDEVAYPFSSAGRIVPLQNVDYALETRSKPICATTEELIAFVKERDLAARTTGGLSDRTARWTELSRQWLYVPGKPQMSAANFDSYVL